MIDLLKPRTWSITTRLVMVATIPALLMVLVVNGALYILGLDDAERSLRERGELLAAALAETSFYPVISGNVAVLDRNARELIKTDPGVASVEILDDQRARLAGATAGLAGGGVVFERAIRADAPAVSLFEQSEPHVTAEPVMPSDFRPTAVAGFVRVEMSALPGLQAQYRRLLLSGLMVLAAAAVSGLIGLYLARSLQAPLAVVMRALRQIRGGNFDIGIERRSAGELGELQQAIADMAAALSLQDHEMKELVDQRTTELRQAVEKASEADAQKRRLLARTNTMLEEERQRIAGEVHDEFNAALIVISMKAQQIAALSRIPHDAETNRVIAATARDIEVSTDELYSAAREIVKSLRPEVIDTLGLTGAIAEIVRNYDELNSNCSMRLDVAATFPALKGEVAMTIYRLVQEALSNIIKHAKAKHVSVSLDRDFTQPVALIVVKDDGEGFDPSDVPKDSFGLLGMRERVQARGGSLTINTVRGGGTTVSIRLPFPKRDDHPAQRSVLV